MQRLLLFITLTIFSYQTTQAARALKSEFEQKGLDATVATLQKAKEQQSSQGKKGISLCADDEVFQPYFPKAIQGIIRAYTMNPLDFVTALYRQLIVKIEKCNKFVSLAIQPDGTIITRINSLLDNGDICALDNNGRKLSAFPNRDQFPHNNTVVQKNGTIVEMHDDLVTVYRYNQGEWKTISSLKLNEHHYLGYSHAPGIFRTRDTKNETFCLWNEHDCSRIVQYPNSIMGGGVFVVVGNGATFDAQSTNVFTREGLRSYKCTVYNPDRSIRIQFEDSHLEKIMPIAMGPDGNFLIASVGSPAAYIRRSNFMLSHILEGHSKGIECGMICPEGTMLTGSYDDTIRIWDNNGSLRSVLRYQETPHVLAEHNGTIVTGGNSDNLYISRADTRLTELLGQFSFAQQQEIKELIQALEEMYWMKHNSIVVTPAFDAKHQAEAIANIELVLFGKHAELFAMLPRAIQENIMQNMRCKFSVEQSNNKQTKQADNSKESKS